MNIKEFGKALLDLHNEIAAEPITENELAHWRKGGDGVVETIRLAADTPDEPNSYRMLDDVDISWLIEWCEAHGATSADEKYATLKREYEAWRTTPTEEITLLMEQINQKEAQEWVSFIDGLLERGKC